MYGIVNQAIQGLVVENYGQEKWDEILKRSGISETHFISNDSYEDEITFELNTYSIKNYLKNLRCVF